MGKLKRSSVIKKNMKQSGKGKKTQLAIEDLLENAEINFDQFQLETAFKFVKQALDLDPKHVEALELMASVQMKMGNLESAKSVYLNLVELQPGEGFRKYMCLAQLSSGQEAIDFYKKGVELMTDIFNKETADATAFDIKPSTSKGAQASFHDQEDDEDEDDGKTVSKSDISMAYGSMGEIYLTDLCMEAEASSLCKHYLEKSLEFDAENPETLQLLASYWISEENLDEARVNILKSLEIWLPKYIDASENGGPLIDPSQVIPLTYDSRINTSRILTEVEEFDKSIVVLEQLIEEDDEVVVVWYMIGWANHCKGQEYYGNAKYYLKKAQELATKIKYEQKYLDDQLRSHIQELLDQLKEVASEEEDEEEDENEVANKENTNEGDESDYSESDEDEAEDENNNTTMKINNESVNLLVSKKSSNKKSTLTNSKSQNDEPMEFT